MVLPARVCGHAGRMQAPAFHRTSAPVRNFHATAARLAPMGGIIGKNIPEPQHISKPETFPKETKVNYQAKPPKINDEKANEIAKQLRKEKQAAK